MDHYNATEDDIEWANNLFRDASPEWHLRSRTNAGLTVALNDFEDCRFDPLTADDGGPFDKTVEDAEAFARMLHTFFHHFFEIELSHLTKLWVECGKKNEFDEMVDELFWSREAHKRDLIAERDARRMAKEASAAETANAVGEEGSKPACSCGKGEAPPPYPKEDGVSPPETEKQDVWPTEMLPFRSLKPWAGTSQV
ncbi:hypothetical protein H2200_003558 [Cladophialophora chaetospira]|uniref:Uncharacterized protein n=1 Tax=Cladophialophora chaetospira TaxID=386627 RepID=A0AA38XEF0_9EURO|nr:hypothetical protein H2200_003558 [Cladophialophora chaetospira]